MKIQTNTKYSGHVWIGNIPIDWSCIALRHLAEVMSSNIDKKTEPDEIPIRLCNYLDVYKNNYISSEISFMSATATEAQITKFRLQKGDVIATKDSEDPKDIAIPALVVEDFSDVVCGYHLTLMRAHSRALRGEFLFWLLNSTNYRHYFSIAANGVTRFGIGTSAFKDVPVVFPGLDLQYKIATYLDRKTTEIDTLISKKQKLIALLEEERTALINQTVTRGIDSNVKLKASGIEWLGEVPKSWSITPLKYLAQIKGRVGYRGYTVADLVAEGEGALTIGAKHISKDNRLDLSSSEFISWEKYYESPEIMVEKGDILLTQRGTLGKVVLLDHEIGKATINPSMVILKEIQLSKKYLYYVFCSKYFLTWVDYTNTATAVPMLSQEQLGNFKISFPSPEQQIQIAKYLDSNLERLKTLVKKMAREIELLNEYKTALISEVVTGKVDVRYEPVNAKPELIES